MQSQNAAYTGKKNNQDDSQHHHRKLPVFYREIIMAHVRILCLYFCLHSLPTRLIFIQAEDA